jgi:hypothetical protein
MENEQRDVCRHYVSQIENLQSENESLSNSLAQKEKGE